MPVQELQQEAGALHPAGFSPVNPGELLCNASKMSSFALAAKSLPTVTVINDGGGVAAVVVCVCVQSPGCYFHALSFSLSQGDPLLPRLAWPRGWDAGSC